MPLIRAVILSSFLVSHVLAANADAISLKIMALNPIAKAGGKIMLRVTVTNDSNAPITFHNISRNCDYTFQVLKGGSVPAPETEYKKATRCTPLHGELLITNRDIVVILKPGESSSEEVAITENYEMSAAGIYSLKVDRTFPDLGHFSSSVVTVTVTP